MKPRHEVSKHNLQEKFDEQGIMNAESEASPENLPENKEMELLYIIEAASQALKEVYDVELKSALQVVVSRVTTLSGDVPRL